jgi:hypothetical protein
MAKFGRSGAADATDGANFADRFEDVTPEAPRDSSLTSDVVRALGELTIVEQSHALEELGRLQSTLETLADLDVSLAELGGPSQIERFRASRRRELTDLIAGVTSDRPRARLHQNPMSLVTGTDPAKTPPKGDDPLVIVPRGEPDLGGDELRDPTEGFPDTIADPTDNTARRMKELIPPPDVDGWNNNRLGGRAPDDPINPILPGTDGSAVISGETAAIVARLGRSDLASPPAARFTRPGPGGMPWTESAPGLARSQLEVPSIDDSPSGTLAPERSKFAHGPLPPPGPGPDPRPSG